MARINLLTIHWGRSFGAVFQTYATCRILENLGHKVTVINLSSPSFEKTKWKWQNIKYAITNFRFDRFKKKYFSKLTNKGTSISDIKLPEADVTIVGSDQVWNRDITKENALTFFLDFVPQNQKRISLASSFGKSVWQEDKSFSKVVKENLQKFTGITVRESSGKEIIESTFGGSATQVLDPTLALGDFANLIDKKQNISQIYPFILCNKQEEYDLVNELSSLLDIKVFKRNFWNVYLSNSPKVWLNRIRNSEYIVTDSFHGLAFSILFHKQFFMLCGDPQKFTRIQSCLELFGLQDRFVRNKEDLHTRWNELLPPIDYNNVDVILCREREVMTKFLKEKID